MSRFPTTRWSLIRRASDESIAGSREQMDELLRRYWQPMFVHLTYKGVPAEKAEDLIQDFVLEILNNDLLAIADPQKGKFRTLVLVALDRFRAGRHRYDTAAKRSPGDVASLDATETEHPDSVDAAPSLAFERAWCLEVLAQVLADMKAECEENEQLSRWQVFEQRVLVPLFEGTPAPEYEDLSERLGFENAKAAANQLTSAKRQFARQLRRAIRDYVVRLAETPSEGTSGDTAERGITTVDHTNDGLQQHMIAQQVEREIDELREILSKSRDVAERVRAAAVATGGKSEFWRSLVQREELSTVLDWGTDDVEWDDATLSACMAELLDSPLQSLAGLGYQGDGTLQQCLLDPAPPAALLEAIKDWANVHRMGGNKAMPPKLAKCLYFLSLAIGLSRHGQKMTGSGDHALRDGFVWTLEQTWLPSEFGDLVQSAVDAVQVDPR